MIHFSLFRKRAVWLPTWRGWILLALSFGGLLSFVVRHIHPFLAVTQTVSANVLIVGGWLPDDALKSSFEEFSQGGYDYLVTTGGPIETGSYLFEFKDFATLGAAKMKVLGLNVQNLLVVPAPFVMKNRTYAATRAVLEKLRDEQLDVRGINVVSLGTHARRARMVYAKVFPKVPVGIIAQEPNEYDASQWWNYSAGLVAVLNGTIRVAYEWLLDSGRGSDELGTVQ
jgi:hypothetical protein